MAKLGARLNTVLRSVPKGAIVADIGTDHAFLPIALINEGIAKKVIASDVKPKPLQNAKQNIEKAGIVDIELRLSDGLNGFTANEVDCVVIAGMGGNVIKDILDRAKWIKRKNITLVLQSMSSTEVLREYLYTNGFLITKEKAVIDGDRVYSVITACYCGETSNIDEAKLYIGELMLDNSVAATRYIKLQYDRLSSVVKSVKNSESRQNDYNKMKIAAAKIGLILNQKNRR